MKKRVQVVSNSLTSFQRDVLAASSLEESSLDRALNHFEGVTQANELSIETLERLIKQKKQAKEDKRLALIEAARLEQQRIIDEKAAEEARIAQEAIGIVIIYIYIYIHISSCLLYLSM